MPEGKALVHVTLTLFLHPGWPWDFQICVPRHLSMNQLMTFLKLGKAMNNSDDGIHEF